MYFKEIHFHKTNICAKTFSTINNCSHCTVVCLIETNQTNPSLLAIAKHHVAVLSTHMLLVFSAYCGALPVFIGKANTITFTFLWSLLFATFNEKRTRKSRLVFNTTNLHWSDDVLGILGWDCLWTCFTWTMSTIHGWDIFGTYVTWPCGLYKILDVVLCPWHKHSK